MGKNKIFLKPELLESQFKGAMINTLRPPCKRGNGDPPINIPAPPKNLTHKGGKIIFLVS
jgi:hypothetical protein